MIAVNDADFSNVDAVFCCLPHGTTQVYNTFLLTLCIQYIFAGLDFAYSINALYTIPFYYAGRELFAFQILVEDCWTTKNQFKPSFNILLLTYSFFLQEIIKALPKGLKIVDLSAVSTGRIFFRCPVCNLMSYSFQSYLIMQDFRLRDIDDYEKWYGQPHRAPELQVGFYMFNKNIWCTDFNEFPPLNVHFCIIILLAQFFDKYSPFFHLNFHCLRVNNSLILFGPREKLCMV